MFSKIILRKKSGNFYLAQDLLLFLAVFFFFFFFFFFFIHFSHALNLMLVIVFFLCMIFYISFLFSIGFRQSSIYYVDEGAKGNSKIWLRITNVIYLHFLLEN